MKKDIGDNITWVPKFKNVQFKHIYRKVDDKRTLNKNGTNYDVVIENW